MPGHDKNEDRNRDSGDCQSKFNIFHIHHDDHELDGESKEEEEVELKKCDVNLGAEISKSNDPQSRCQRT